MAEVIDFTKRRTVVPDFMRPALDVLLWRDKWASGKVFVGGLAVYGAIFVYGYSLLSLFSIFLCLHVVISVLINLLLRWRGRASDARSPPPQISPEFVSSLCEHVNCKIAQYFDMLQLLDIVSAASVCIVLYILYRLGLIFSDATLMLIGYLLAFSLPSVYVKYERQVEDAVSKVRSRMQQVSDAIYNSIPRADTLKKDERNKEERKKEERKIEKEADKEATKSEKQE
ncbi:hypothetical protein GUITHDRAFT_166041 [Guillardia theta CCMP2712]|uniref:Reticulon-like protein n=2 Tax=Guillardia theta TaxID=55529 RepID=L1IG51_GUITC|nr:hypothetical protein GUITHDRAFT_166041 [Guillardia theta CCMP2712]EKX35223.1 hypothetical protein GUITHDRAFT_166041 [Guillardia theta CCMP2712]|eukprot:XP_005822203.1 hypothetical protein GUITHDRAFT_166041 [Guillardia theta CCMP2712]